MPINFPIIQQRKKNDFLEGIGFGSDLVGSLLKSRMQSQLHPQELRKNEIENALRQFNLENAPDNKRMNQEKYNLDRKLDQSKLKESILNANLKPGLNKAQINAYESQARANDARANRYNNPIEKNASDARDRYYTSRANEIDNKTKTYSFDRLSNAEKENQISLGVSLTGYPRDKVTSDLRKGVTLQDYRNEFGVSDEQFNKLQASNLPSAQTLNQQQKTAAGRAGFNAIHKEITDARAPYVDTTLPNGLSLKFEKENIVNNPKTRDSRAKYLASTFLAGSDIANILRTEGVQAGITAIRELKDDFLLRTKKLYPQDKEVYELANKYSEEWIKKIADEEREVQLNPGKAVERHNKEVLGNNKKISDEELQKTFEHYGIS